MDFEDNEANDELKIPNILKNAPEQDDSVVPQNIGKLADNFEQYENNADNESYENNGETGEFNENDIFDAGGNPRDREDQEYSDGETGQYPETENSGDNKTGQDAEADGDDNQNNVFFVPDNYQADNAQDDEQSENEDENDNNDIVNEIDDENNFDGNEETGTENQSPSQQENNAPAVEPFKPGPKTAPGLAIGGSKPLKLNRQALLYIILGAVCLIVGFVSFVMPAFENKKMENARKKEIEKGENIDYSLYADRRDYDYLNNDDYFDNDGYEEALERDPYSYQDFPKPDFSNDPAVTASYPSGASSTGGTERPDTRNDRLQGKSISGIKGISSSRQNYATPDNQFPQYINSQAETIDNPYAQFGLPPKDQYMQNLTGGMNAGGGSNYANQNDQSGKTRFMNQGREDAGGGEWLPVNSVWQGTIFEATLTSNINTDLPGECTAWVVKNIYCSLDGSMLLIPQNSRLLGSYNSSVSYGQGRIQIGWHTLIRPDGYMINLGNMNATDPTGANGLKGFVNEHPFAYLKAILLLTALNVVNTQFDSTMSQNAAAANPNPYVQNVLANSQDMSNRLADKVIERALDIQPTITIKSGTKINIVANYNLVLPPLMPYKVDQKYRRGR